MNAQVKAILDEIERMLTFDGSISTSYYIGKRDAERELKAFINSLQVEPEGNDDSASKTPSTGRKNAEFNY